MEFQLQHQSFQCTLISFRMDWLNLLVVQGTLKSLLQHHSSKASIFQHSAFFTVHLSHPYMTTGKTIALTRWAFVSQSLALKDLLGARAPGPEGIVETWSEAAFSWTVQSSTRGPRLAAV